MDPAWLRSANDAVDAMESTLPPPAPGLTAKEWLQKSVPSKLAPEEQPGRLLLPCTDNFYTENHEQWGPIYLSDTAARLKRRFPDEYEGPPSEEILGLGKVQLTGELTWPSPACLPFRRPYPRITERWQPVRTGLGR
jgi:hypothetical protein